jgi:hypothetical protein
MSMTCHLRRRQSQMKVQKAGYISYPAYHVPWRGLTYSEFD